MHVHVSTYTKLNVSTTHVFVKEERCIPRQCDQIGRLFKAHSEIFLAKYLDNVINLAKTLGNFRSNLLVTLIPRQCDQIWLNFGNGKFLEGLFSLLPKFEPTVTIVMLLGKSSL